MSTFAEIKTTKLDPASDSEPAEFIKRNAGDGAIEAHVIGGTIVVTPSGTQDVNVVEIGGNAVTTTIPVSGTVTANLGTIDGAATAANQATEIASLASIDSKLTSPVAVTGTVAVSNFPATQPVSGTVTANQGTSPWVVSGTVTAVPGGATATLANGVETPVSSSAVQILAANGSRKAAIIQNTGSANVRVGVVGVAPTTGLRLLPDAIAIFEEDFVTTQALYAIREGAIDSITFAQELS